MQVDVTNEATPSRSAMADVQQPKKIPLSPLPLPYELLALAIRYAQAAYELSPYIARRPTQDGLVDMLAEWQEESDPEDVSQDTRKQRREDATEERADTIASYRRYIGMAIICLKRVVSLEGGGDVRLDLRARAMLAELLVRETKNTVEAESILTKGIVAASRHDGLFEYRCHFGCLHIELALANQDVKFARMQTKRLIKEISDSQLQLPIWTYRLLLQHMDICLNYENDYPAGLACLRDLQAYAKGRGDLQMVWVSKLQMARVAMLKGDDSLAKTLVADLAGTFHLPMTNGEMEDQQNALDEKNKTRPKGAPREKFFLQLEATSDLPKHLVTHALVLISIYQAYLGEMKVAKMTVKRAHDLLDADYRAVGEEEGFAVIPIKNPDATGAPLSIRLATLTRELFYAYTFLISTLVQSDPTGKMPKCLKFALAGLSTLDAKVRGTEMNVFPRNMSIADIEETILQIASVEADMMLYTIELYLTRSEFEKMQDLFLDCIAFVQAHDLWHLYSARITLIQGMFSHALEQWDEAYKCYSIAAALTADPHMRHLNILARASILFIRFAQGRTVNFSNTSGSRSIKLDKGATPTKRTSEQEELTRLARDIISDCQQDGTVPLLKMLGNIVLAMVNGEVARGRALLGLAIAQADNTNNLHFKPLILALLSSYFLHMRNDQAQKMLHSAHTVCRTLGGHNTYASDSEAKSFESETVGLARLGLWTGEQLLDIYEREGQLDRAKKQKRYNDAHRQVIQQERRCFVGEPSS